MYIAKKYHIKTFGCQANMADSGTMGGILEALGWERFVPSRNGIDGKAVNEDAELEEVLTNVDLLIINSCSVRQKSEDKVYGMGKMVKKVLAEKGKKPVIILAGCMVGSAVGERKRFEPVDLKKKMPWVDEFISPAEIFTLPNILQSAKKLDAEKIHPVVDYHLERESEDVGQGSIKSNKNFAYVNISTGCDNFCSYCVVPYARGKEISRPKEVILREVKNLLDRGYTRVMLCGQNVNSWGLGAEEKMKIRAGEIRQTPFVDLLKEVRQLPNLEELAFISSNPFDFTQELVDALKLPKMSKYLHIAVQSGNDAVLKKMNRRHTAQEFTNLVDAIRRAVPDIELGTDAIVGFPTETREQFMDTVALFKKVKFRIAFISMYSARKGTLAEKLYVDDVPLKEKKWRHAYLTRVWRESLKDGDYGD